MALSRGFSALRSALLLACAVAVAGLVSLAAQSSRPAQPIGGQTWRDSHLTLPVCQFFNVACDMDVPFHVYGSMLV